VSNQAVKSEETHKTATKLRVIITLICWQRIKRNDPK